MTTAIILDSCLLGLATHPRGGPDAKKCHKWVKDLIAKDYQIFIPEIANYEIRREFILNNSMKALNRLDSFINLVEYHPLNTKTMHLAADLWAQARKMGKPTADDKALDADMILCAQAQDINNSSSFSETIIATTNVKHLSIFCDARSWEDISP